MVRRTIPVFTPVKSRSGDSLVTQRALGIDAGGAPGGEEARGESGSTEAQHGPGDDGSVERLDAEQLGLDQLRKSHRRGYAHGYADHENEGDFAKDQQADIPALGAESHADTDARRRQLTP